MRFIGKTALVTGGGSGIGRATAMALAREGAGVGLCGRRAGPLELVAEECRRLGARALACPLDVRGEAAVSSALARIENELGPLDVVVISHGENALARIEETSLARWEELIGVNLTGAFVVVREAVRRMRPRGRGRIVLVSSVSGRPGFIKYAGFGPYAASKYGLTGLLEVLAAETEGTDIVASMVAPGGVDTAMFRATFPGVRPTIAAERVADAILALADPARTPPPATIVDVV